MRDRGRHGCFFKDKVEEAADANRNKIGFFDSIIHNDQQHNNM